MATEQFTLVIDKEYLEKLGTFYLYRSRETLSDRPTINGVYIQHRYFGEQPPDEITIRLEWQQNDT